jgi:hypothetical protein
MAGLKSSNDVHATSSQVSKLVQGCTDNASSCSMPSFLQDGQRRVAKQLDTWQPHQQFSMQQNLEYHRWTCTFASEDTSGMLVI